MTDTTVEPAAAIHRGDGELPWVDAGGGTELKVMMVRDDEGLWIVRNRFAPGVVIQTHRHTGPVYAHTLSGSPGSTPSIRRSTGPGRSCSSRPAASTPSPCPEDNTEPTDVWFQIHGVNLNLDADGNVESITDGSGVLAAYYALCEAQGLSRPERGHLTPADSTSREPARGSNRWRLLRL